jgi:hypothetical protein
MKLETLFAKAIECYTDGEKHTVEIYPDPQVDGTYAIRSRSKKNTAHDWLVCKLPRNATVGVVVDYLEECEFETWPPQSGGLQFF